MPDTVRCVVSVDLAFKRAQDIGVCVLTRAIPGVSAEFVSLSRRGAAGSLGAAWVAETCAELCRARGGELLLLDGPQAWKEAASGRAPGRRCEQALHTPAKTGEPGNVKPRPYAPFVEFSIAVFDALHRLGWPRLESRGVPRGRRALEVFPFAAWRRLGLAPLPAKAKCTPDQLAACERALLARCRVRTNRTATHDELQALVSGVAGLALVAGDAAGFELLGEPPALVAGAWREGFILVPRPAPA